MASVKDLTRFGIEIAQARKISEKDFDALVRQGCRPEIGDVLIAKDGNSALDTVCNIKSEVEVVMLSSVAILRPDPTKILSDFLKFYLSATPTVQYLKSNFISGAAIPRVVLRDFKKADVPLPPLEEQKRIAHILGTLDDKIELNHRMNRTLEAMAQAIFKSWFVDFEPVKAKAAAKAAGASPEEIERAAMAAVAGKTEAELDQLPEHQQQSLAQTAALFPDAFHNSELGEIPEGWIPSTFGAESECLDSKRIPLSKREREKRQGKFPYYGATSVVDHVDDFLFDETLLLLGEDGSVVHPDGTPFTQYVWGKIWVNNHAHVLRGVAPVSTEQLLLFIQQTDISSRVTGAVQLKLNQKNMKSIPFVRADNSMHEAFQNFTEPLFEMIKNTTREVETLAQLRDALLPKLLSGEPNAPEAKPKIEEALT